MQLKSSDEAAPHPSSAGRHPVLGDLIDWPNSVPCVPENGRAPPFAGLAAERYASELAWLAKLPNVTRSASCILAAHAVGCAMAMRPDAYGAARGDGSIPLGLASLRPDRLALESASTALLSESDPIPNLSAADLACIDALWPLTAPTEFLLASGGDDRLLLDPDTGLNKYGCAPWPRPDVLSFGSCTASSLSTGAFEAAEAARRALAAASLATSPATALAEASEAIGASLLCYFNVQDLAEAVLAASGTDAALVVTGLLAAEHPGETLTSVLVSPTETGSGVPDAVQGRHFASCAPSGRVVGKGETIDGLACGPTLVTVALRDENGAPRPAEDVDAAFVAAIRKGIGVGRVVLHAMDGSKTGLTAPRRATLSSLAHTYGPKLDIVIDACQARIEPSLVRSYLQQGFPVLITGSKFFSAPGFCGAVLFPRERLERITKRRRLPAGLAAYARLQGGFGSRRCPGLVLRWTAALYEMGIFQQLPDDMVGAVLDRIDLKISTQIAEARQFRMIEAPRPSGRGWSDRRSIFTFGVLGPSGLLDMARLRRLYLLLGEDCSTCVDGGAIRCQIGQPVQIGGTLAGLRIAVSSEQIVSPIDHSEALGLVFDKLRRLVDRPLEKAAQGLRAFRPPPHAIQS